MDWLSGVGDFLGDNWESLVGAGIGAWDASQGTPGQTPFAWPGEADFRGTTFNAGTDLWNYGAAEYYPNNTVAPRDSNVTAGEQSHLGNLNILQGLADAGASGAQRLAQGGAGRIAGFTLPDGIGFGIPEDYANAIIDPIYNKLEQEVVPGIHTAATQQGAFGGSRTQQQKSDALAQTTEAATNALIQGNLLARGQSIGQRAGDIDAQLQGRSQDIQQNSIYNTALANSTNALNAAQAMQLVPGSTQMNVGNRRTAYNQALLNDDVARWDHDEMRDEELLNRMFGWMSGSPTYSPGTGGTAGGDWLDILAGAVQGSNIGNVFFPSGDSSRPPLSTPPYIGP